MQFTLFSVFMAVIWSSLLAAFSYFCRKKHFFIRQFGIMSLLFLYLFTFIRMVIPYDFYFSRAVPANKFISGLYQDIHLEWEHAGRVSPLMVLFLIWLAVAAALLLRFVIQYARAAKEISAYRVRTDEQCRMVFGRVMDEGKKRMEIEVRRSGTVNSPMGIGLFRKRIILPDEDYSDQELYYILRHEYMHFQNHDLLLKILVHSFRCIFWWNPIVYLMEKGLAQTLEIRCDLDVTEGMDNLEKAGYLSAIVSTLKRTNERRNEKIIHGSTTLVSSNYQSETKERFRLICGEYNAKKNMLLTVSWFLASVLLMAASYSIIICPIYEPPIEEIETDSNTHELTPENSYLIKHADGTYTGVYCGDGSEQAVKEEMALIMISQGFEVREEEVE